MKKASILILTFLVFLALFSGDGYAKKSGKTTIPPPDPEMSTEIKDEKADNKADIESLDDPKDKEYRKNVDDTVEQINKAIRDLRTSYQNKTVWEMPYGPPAPNESSGKKLARYALTVPTYAVRMVTWPLAVATYYLIREGVANKVIDLMSNNARTFWVYPRVEMGFGSGFGGGIGFHHFNLFHDNFKASGYYQIHINMNQEAKFDIRKPDAFYWNDRPVEYKFWSKFIRHHVTDFFGIGIESSDKVSAKYGLDQVRWGGYIGTEFLDNMWVKLYLEGLWDNSRAGKDGPNVTNVFSRSELIAYGRQLLYMVPTMEFVRDTRDSDVVPEHGGYQKAFYSRYQGLNTTKYDYCEVGVDVAQFFRLLLDRHVLVTRVAMKYQPQSGDGIPFYRMLKLDMNTPLRGFDYGRFADRGLAIFNAEYRFPVWQYMDGQLFFDTGRTFHSLGDFSFKHFKYSGGVGIRIRTDQFLLMRLQFAYGGEGPKFLVKTSKAF